jgi:Bacterial CdiA-CT RNAse A domain
VGERVTALAVSGAIMVRGWQVAQFVKSSRSRYVFEQAFDRVVGCVTTKGGGIRMTKRIRVVLQRDPTRRLGYFIRTSYPIL